VVQIRSGSSFPFGEVFGAVGLTGPLFPAGQQGIAAGSPCGGHLFGQGTGDEFIIRIQKLDEGAGGFLQPQIPRDTGSLIGLFEEAYSLGLERGRECRFQGGLDVLGGAIVDHDHFHGWVGKEAGANRPSQRCTPVENRDDDRHSWAGFIHRRILIQYCIQRRVLQLGKAVFLLHTALEVQAGACYIKQIMHRNASNPCTESLTDISVVIPTYRRGPVLLDTLRHVLALDPAPSEILIVDQTEWPEPEVAEVLAQMETEGRIRWLRHAPPSIPQAMNRGLLEAKGHIVLFLDDDIIPQLDLVTCHRQAYESYPEAWAVAGRILQPEDEENGVSTDRQPSTDFSFLRQDLDFSFAGNNPAWVTNVMAGHLSVNRDRALAAGGFDENFIPPVSFRFETEFAKRLVAAGGKIRFEPQASLQHLRAGSGGTRSQGSHLTSASPVHGVGDYYYAKRWGKGWGRMAYIVRRPFREVCTRFHLTHPWWIPVKLVGELRAIAFAFRLHRAGPRLLEGQKEGEGSIPLRIVLVGTVAPDRPNGSMVRYGQMVREALEQVAGGEVQIEELNLAPPQVGLNRFPPKLRTPIRYARIALAARRLLPQKRDCILHLLDGSHAYLLNAAGALSSPLVCTVHDLIPALRLKGDAGMPPLGRVGAWLTRRTLSGLCRSKVWLADSGSTRQDLIRLAGVPADRVHVAPPAVDFPEEIPAGPSGGALPPFILHVAGNNTFYKNRQGVIEIFKGIRQAETVSLKMVGAPPDAVLLQKVRESGVASDIEFLPNVSEAELAALYRQASFLLFPSLYEGFGWPPLEAMAQGCPVICSDAGSLPEVVGDAAWVAPVGTVNDFIEHGLHLLRNPDARERLRGAGRSRAQRFSMEALASGLMAVYRTVEGTP